ncbi:MAG: ATP-binding protein [bacterium]
MTMLASQFAGSLLISLLIGGVLLYLRRRDGSTYLLYWALASFVASFRYGFSLAAFVHHAHPAYEALTNVSVVLAGFFLLWGVYDFNQRLFPRYWLAAGASMLAWAAIAPFTGASFWVVTGPAFLFRGLTDFVAGVSMLKRQRGFGATLAGISFVLWGLHRLNYPFLRPVEWFAPWGFAIATVLSISVAVGIITAHYDVARSQANQRELEFRTLFENALDGIFRVSTNGRLLIVNPAFAGIVGRSVAQLENLQLEELFPAETAKELLAGASEDIEQTWQRADGRNVHVTVRMRRANPSEGAFFEGTVRDVTRTRMMTEQLDLARRMDALGRLAGGIAHDFNNILTAIIGATDLAEMEIANGESPAENLSIVRLSANKAAELSAQLLMFTRQRATDPAPVALNDALVTCESMLKRLLPDTIELVVRRAANDCRVVSRPGELERVILNLAVNAQDAMPKGGLLEITASCSEDANAHIVVKDTGAGMDPAVLKRIFEPYFSTKVSRGTGLGLANVYQIVESMGGQVAVDSAIGRGSEFTITLPATTSKTTPRTPEPRAAVVEGGPLVLLVEDREFVRRSTADILRRSGYRVMTAKDGEEALEIARGHIDAIDVVLTDVMMAKLDGADLIRELQALRPDIKYLLMSGHFEQDLDLSNHGKNFINKPFSASELVAKLEEVRG